MLNRLREHFRSILKCHSIIYSSFAFMVFVFAVPLTRVCAICARASEVYFVTKISTSVILLSCAGGAVVFSPGSKNKSRYIPV